MIAFLDDDDWWETTKLARQVSYLKEQNAACGGVSCLIQYYKGGRVVRKSLPYRGGRIYKEILGRTIEVSTCTILLKRLSLDQTGYFNETLPRHQEVQLLSFFTYQFELLLLPEHLTCVDISENLNMPTIEKLYTVKAMFFEAVAPLMNTLTPREKRQIFLLHEFEIAYAELRRGSKIVAITKILKTLQSPKAFCLAMKRCMDRIRERKINNTK